MTTTKTVVGKSGIEDIEEEWKKNGHSHGKNNGNSELSDDNTMAKVYEYETYDTANALEVSFNTIKTSSTIDQNRYKYIPDYWFEDEPSKAKEESNKVPPDEDAVQIVGVRFKETGKVYYFAPMDFVLKEGDHVIVETARGLEYGVVVLSNRYVPRTVACCAATPGHTHSDGRRRTKRMNKISSVSVRHLTFAVKK